MRWIGRRGSDNVEDRRSGGGGFGGLPIPLTGGGILLLLIISFIMGRNPLELLSGGTSGPEQNVTAQAPAESDSAARFASVVLADTEEVWGKLFAQAGKEYRKPTLVLFRNQVQSGCGGASSSSGPFYCPSDEKLYIDLSFYDELHDRLGAPGDFAMAYVIAHEVGHHVQNLLGTTAKVEQARSDGNEAGAEGASVRLELQADYYAGVWAHYEDSELGAVQVGDIDEALNAASAVGDDRLQKQSQGEVVPDAFTHGTSAQRRAWFEKGYKSGDPAGGDTFAAESL